ncbi:D-galactose 1-dehydrogenase [Pacificibacter maritimus]|uniref:D-galactose 1-dehydrogenase n=1 Tax=Pacificibacter maritimus TaxID=762213 RepID=A0A3N4V4U0_9RHOB|nr:Gfo/Idh/MocA family oxidoreductase [Pacificibacter maritimus]RPE72127.1 D-galactose 1-dehydrogenase [Pacificibacter maritimus]
MEIALVGIGEIAKAQHIPSIAASPNWKLAATVSRFANLHDVPNFTDFDEMLSACPNIRVVSLCTPPVPRFNYALAALKAGRHVMLEKPPGATLSECQTLLDVAKDQGVTLFSTWHSREAVMVQSAKEWLAGAIVHDLQIIWKEDVRRWHPDQEWIWEPGGMGVLDPGINALSILTEILPDPIHIRAARLDVPEGRQTPIAAFLEFAHPHGATVTADLDWRQTGPQTWDIKAQTDKGTLHLSQGGAVLEINGAPVNAPHNHGEYLCLYTKMANLVAKGECDVDLAPLRHVADAFMLGHRATTDPFDW